MPHRLQSTKEVYPTLLAEHDYIIACVEAKDREKAKEVTRTHIMNQEKTVGDTIRTKNN